ncbi:myb-CC type transfactor, lheqle motif protein [Medicago truncatula]|uniref:Myb-CC type transfactor, lheqle motif protein n=1 Tax=Medicago truncatula TaxID=3880 RepID=G7IDU0_MEDTR|nr:myb-CC type transfactor, lheqle motif protein [Medicago truncatula]
MWFNLSSFSLLTPATNTTFQWLLLLPLDFNPTPKSIHFISILFTSSSFGNFIPDSPTQDPDFIFIPKSHFHHENSLNHHKLTIQRNLQLRIEEQGRYLQMMFEKQCKSGVEPFKASSSAIEKCVELVKIDQKDQRCKGAKLQVFES